ncbi:zinc ribbon domain-containing protein [Desulfovibrio sp. OttesenSCG-928-A18]|nr:zinc ribbon domain-containing protein [Desulfovibrio sp. OttesenSCG-928-A18]
MPIYEYRCEDCQQVFEEWCRRVEDAKVQHPCPICKGQAKRLISNTSFALKGGGWYVTEYGSRKNCNDGASCGATSCGAESADRSSNSKDACAAAGKGAGTGTGNGTGTGKVAGCGVADGAGAAKGASANAGAPVTAS